MLILILRGPYRIALTVEEDQRAIIKQIHGALGILSVIGPPQYALTVIQTQLTSRCITALTASEPGVNVDHRGW